MDLERIEDLQQEVDDLKAEITQLNEELLAEKCGAAGDLVVRFNRTVDGWIAYDQFSNYGQEKVTQMEALGSWVAAHASGLRIED